MKVFSDSDFQEMNVQTDQFSAKYDDYIVGYILMFRNGKKCYTNIEIDTDKNSPTYKMPYLVRTRQFDPELNRFEEKMASDFVEKINNSIAEKAAKSDKARKS